MSGVIGRHGATVIAMAVGAAIAIVGSLVPWVRTGGRTRNSYDVFELVERFGFAPDGVVGSLIRWWPLVPLLTIGAMVLAWWGWRRPGGLLGVVAGVYAAAVGGAVTTAPSAIDIEAGPWITVAGGVVLLVASVATCAISPPGRSPTHPAG